MGIECGHVATYSVFHEYKKDTSLQLLVTKFSTSTLDTNTIMADEKDFLSGLDILANSKHRFNSILLSFRNLYDLCLESRIFSRETIDYIATLALTFQHLGSESAAAAKRTASSDYFDEVITFYHRVVEYVLTNKKGMKEKLIFIGEQAKVIGKIYKVITAWGSWIAAQCHECLREAMNEINEYKEKHADVLRKAKIERDAVNDIVEKAKAELKSAKSSAEHWQRVAAATSWIPFANIGTASKARSEISNYKDAKAKEKEDEKLFSRATQNLRKAQRDDERALVIESSIANNAGISYRALYNNLFCIVHVDCCQGSRRHVRST